jgi:hypothetical protein
VCVCVCVSVLEYVCVSVCVLVLVCVSVCVRVCVYIYIYMERGCGRRGKGANNMPIISVNPSFVCVPYFSFSRPNLTLQRNTMK